MDSLKQSTASQVRAIGPFVDDTDFKTLETALSIANTDVKVKKNGAAAVSKNSGGATADSTTGMYHLTWDATDTNTVGEMFVSVKVAGALVVFLSYVVLEEAVYDSLFLAAAPGYIVDQPVNTTKWAGTSTTTGDIALKTTLAKTTHVTGFNDLSTAQVNTEVDTALSDIQLDHLFQVADPGGVVVNSSFWAKLHSKSATPAYTSYSNLTDSQEAIADTAIPIKAKTDSLTFTVASQVDANALTVSDKAGYSLAADFRIKKNTALANFIFLMVDAVGNPATGLTITAQRSLDGASLTTMANSASEISNGLYKINLAAADTNADFCCLPVQRQWREGPHHCLPNPN